MGVHTFIMDKMTRAHLRIQIRVHSRIINGFTSGGWSEMTLLLQFNLAQEAGGVYWGIHAPPRQTSRRQPWTPVSEATKKRAVCDPRTKATAPRSANKQQDLFTLPTFSVGLGAKRPSCMSMSTAASKKESTNMKYYVQAPGWHLHYCIHRM